MTNTQKQLQYFLVPSQLMTTLPPASCHFSLSTILLLEGHLDTAAFWALPFSPSWRPPKCCVSTTQCLLWCYGQTWSWPPQMPSGL